ncbi:protein YgfX [Undibacterium sp. Ren11W]|uniref:protein YgfX n=1 Tax=Undibacterium sp. Ren11W TaxID=3413045 RepID=UPI003BF42109
MSVTTTKSAAMAIAMTLHPSPTLLCLVLMMYGLANAVFGFAIYHLNLAWWSSSLLLVLTLGLSSLALFKFLVGRRRAYLEISETGDIILRWQNAKHEVISSLLVSLDVQSSCSEYFLILHLRLPDMTSVVIPVLRDSVSADDFRKLAIALRWMTRHAYREQDRLLEDASGNF